jgi:hypothetical protein
VFGAGNLGGRAGSPGGLSWPWTAAAPSPARRLGPPPRSWLWSDRRLLAGSGRSASRVAAADGSRRRSARAAHPLPAGLPRGRVRPARRRDWGHVAGWQPAVPASRTGAVGRLPCAARWWPASHPGSAAHPRRASAQGLNERAPNRSFRQTDVPEPGRERSADPGGLLRIGLLQLIGPLHSGESSSSSHTIATSPSTSMASLTVYTPRGLSPAAQASRERVQGRSQLLRTGSTPLRCARKRSPIRCRLP